MNIQNIRERYFRENPNATAAFVYNERLGKVVCYEYHGNAPAPSTIISQSQIKEVQAYANKTGSSPLDSVIAYLYSSNLDDRIIDKVADYYMHCVETGKTFKTIEEACQAFNENVKLDQQNGKSSRKLITARVVGDDGVLEDFNVFYLEISVKTNRMGGTYCVIENTFTDQDYRKNGLQTDGLRFLDSVLSKKQIYVIIGEAKECDAYESETDSRLSQHYEHLGFVLRTKDDGRTFITKDVDPDAYLKMPITYEEKTK